MNNMNAYTLMVLIHHYINSQEFGTQDGSEPTNSKTHDDAYRYLDKEELILYDDDKNTADSKGYPHYMLTEKGSVHVKTLLQIPLPVASWKSPIQIITEKTPA